jgi:hypothetical protein
MRLLEAVGRRDRVGLAAAVAAALTLGGCVSSEQKAAWVHIESARIIASQNATVVAHPDPQVRVTQVSVVTGPGRLAIVVGLRNLSAHPVNDLPISVGLREPAHGSLYLNRHAGLSYFETHVAEIPGGGRITWLYSGPVPRRSSRASRTSLAGAHAFAVVGRPDRSPITVASRIPPVRAALVSADGRVLRVRVTNLSSIPQVPLPVYALALAGARYSAVGSGSVAALSPGSSTPIRLDLVGHTTGHQPIILEALPTLFH